MIERHRESVVYIIRARGTNHIKIGFSTNVFKRLEALQTGTAFKLDILSISPGSPLTERRIHSELKQDHFLSSLFRHIRLEWYMMAEGDPMNCVYLVPNSAFAFVFGGALHRMDDAPLFLSTWQEAKDAARRCGLYLRSDGVVVRDVGGDMPEPRTKPDSYLAP